MGVFCRGSWHFFPNCEDFEEIAGDVISVLEIPIGNSIRAIVKYLEDITDDVIPGLEIPIGTPWSTSSMPTSSRLRVSVRRGSWQSHPCHRENLEDTPGDVIPRLMSIPSVPS